jgi:hypothetical protein
MDIYIPYLCMIHDSYHTLHTAVTVKVIPSATEVVAPPKSSGRVKTSNSTEVVNVTKVGFKVGM